MNLRSLGYEKFTIASSEAVLPGKATIQFNFVYDGNGVGKGGTGTISIDGKKVAEGRIEQTQGYIFSGDG